MKGDSIDKFYDRIDGISTRFHILVRRRFVGAKNKRVTKRILKGYAASIDPMRSELPTWWQDEIRERKH